MTTKKTLAESAVAGTNSQIDPWPDLMPGGQRGAMDWDAPYDHAVFYRRMWVPATKAAGLHPMRFHDLRHTFASLRANVGAKPHEVAAEMGHGDANITLAIYTHVWRDASDAYADLHSRPPAPTEQDVTPISTKST